MNEKITILRPTGEKEEKKVVCHFKSNDDTKPNIKGVSILIIDEEQTNNGNEVLSFYWEKDGLYGPISDDAAWSEVKSIVISIIKNNFDVKLITLVDNKEVNASALEGRKLSLSSTQKSSLITGANNVASELERQKNEIKVNEEVVNAVSSEPSATSDQNTVIEPFAEDAPGMNDILNGNASEPSVAPTEAVEQVNTAIPEPAATVSQTPVLDQPVVGEVSNPAPVASEPTPVEVMPSIPTPETQTTVSPEPVVEEGKPAEQKEKVKTDEQKNEGGVEIISEPKDNDFDKMQQEIEAATREYQEKVMSIFDVYKKKVEETINEANNLKEQANNLQQQAAEHLKNAQAAAQIADIARQNAENIGSSNSESPVLTLEKAA